jgi:hypothetical protein
VLPQGSSSSADYGEFGRIAPRAYARAALTQVQTLGGLPSAPTIGAVLLSGHAGGGFAIKTILDDQARRRDLSDVFWFDAVQAESGPAENCAAGYDSSPIRGPTRIVSGMSRRAHSGGSTPSRSARMRAKYRSKPAGVQTMMARAGASLWFA